MIRLKFRRILPFLFVFIFFDTAYAQLSVQIAPGLMNYAGDLQNTFYTFNQAEFSISANIMYQLNKLGLRGGFTYGNVKGSDKANALFSNRNLSFETNISEVNLCLEYDFLALNDQRKFTPYVFAGIGYFHFNPYAFYNSQKVYLQPLSTEGEGLSIYPDKKFYSLSQFENPLGIGFKYKVSDNILVGLEFCSRFLYTDYLDDVSAVYPDQNTLLKERGQQAVDLSFRGNEIDPSLPFPTGKSRGNPKHNDNFYTSVFSFIYVFPEHAISVSDKHNKKTHSVDCPKQVH